MIPLPHFRSVRTWVRAALAGAAVSASAQSWSPELDLGLTYNNNVSNSVRQQKHDSALVAAVDVQQVRVLNRDWQGSLRLGADTSFWQEYSGLDLSHLSAELGLRRKFGLGPYAPKLDLRMEGFHQLANVHEWSGNGYRASASLQKRFSPQLSAGLTGELQRFDALRSVYSGTVATLSTTVDWDITPDWRISTSLRYADGTQLSWCRESFPEFVDAGPQWKDGIFGGDWFPYRSEGNVRGLTLGIARALGPHTSLTFVYDASESRAANTHVYRNQTVNLHFTHAF
jgi:hypothetical protein